MEGIPLVVCLALADGPVVVCIAVGVLPAGARARVHALLVVAGQVLRAVAVGAALWPAVGRSPPVLGQAGAGGGVVLNPAGGVGPARGRVARVQLLHYGLGRGRQSGGNCIKIGLPGKLGPNSIEKKTDCKTTCKTD